MPYSCDGSGIRTTDWGGISVVCLLPFTTTKIDFFDKSNQMLQECTNEKYLRLSFLFILKSVRFISHIFYTFSFPFKNSFPNLAMVNCNWNSTVTLVK